MSSETDPLIIDIPDALRDLPLWFNWRWAERVDNGIKKRFKMPCQTTGRAASSIDRHTWTTYDKAAQAAPNFDGLAIGFGHWGEQPDDYCIAGIDLDGAMEDGGGLKDWAAEILARVDSYSEFSPSGKGIHILVKVGPDYLPGIKVNLSETEHVEFYSTARYFTFTGNHVPGTPADLQPRRAVYEALRADYEARRPSSARTRTVRSAEKPATAAKDDERRVTLSDAELLDKAQSGPSGEAFKRLYEGDMSDYRQDHSAADMALAGRLAFWTGKDPEQIDRIFRESGLMRAKWDTRRGLATYGEQTIEIAISNCEDIYTGGDAASTSFVEKLKAKRAAKVAATQVVGSTVKAGHVQDHERGSDKPAYGTAKPPASDIERSNGYTRSDIKPGPIVGDDGVKRAALTGRIIEESGTLWDRGNRDGHVDGDLFGPVGSTVAPPDEGRTPKGRVHVGIPPAPSRVEQADLFTANGIFTGPVKKARTVNIVAENREALNIIEQHGDGARENVHLEETVPLPLLPADVDSSESTEIPLSPAAVPVYEEVRPAVIDVQPNEVELPEDGKYPDPDDIGNADRLVQRYTGKLMWSPGSGWMYWDGRRWAIGDQYAHLAGQETARSIMQEAIDPRLDPEKQKALFAHHHKTAGLGARNAMLTTATVRPQFHIEQKLLDAQDMFLNVLNGTLNLETGELMEHDPEMRITKLAPVHWNPDARSALWEEFLEKATIGQEGLADFLARAVGYTLTGRTLDDVFFVVKGNAGTGKTTFTGSIRNMMGDYATTMRSEVITDKLGGGSGGHQEEIAVLAGRRLILSSETNASDSIKEGLVKGLTGKEEITASRKYGHQMTFNPQFKLWLAANDMPKMRSDDTGMWRRIHKLTFEHKFNPANPAIREALLHDPHHREAILAWAVRGTQAWLRDGLRPPKSVVDATEQLRQSTDRLADFFEDACYFNPVGNLWTSSKDLSEAYWRWANDNSVPERFRPSLRGDTFKNALGHRGAIAKKSSGQRGWSGLILKPDDEQD